MAEAILVDVANALNAVIVANNFGIETQSKVSYEDATRQLKKMTKVVVLDIVPWRSIPKIVSRGVFEYECSVDVIARKKFSDNEQDVSDNSVITVAELNRLVKLMQDIDEFLLTNESAKQLTLASGGWKARIKSTDKKQDYSRIHLYSNDQFSGWNRVTYLAAKEF